MKWNGRAQRALSSPLLPFPPSLLSKPYMPTISPALLWPWLLSLSLLCLRKRGADSREEKDEWGHLVSSFNINLPSALYLSPMWLMGAWIKITFVHLSPHLCSTTTGCTISSQTSFCWHYCRMFRHTFAAAHEEFGRQLDHPNQRQQNVGLSHSLTSKVRLYVLCEQSGGPQGLSESCWV